MKFGVIVFPGSNCDEDMVYVLREILSQETVKIWHKDQDLQGCDWIIVPGGFAYGDYLRAGAIAQFSPIMDPLIKHAQKGGYILGICNGFQVLTEAGLLEGALLRNHNQKYICKNIFLKAQTSNTPLTRGLDLEKPYKIPIAHGEGRFHADPDTLKKLLDQDQVLFKYCSPEGKISEEANPNGSLLNIAGVCNASRNVMGLMPHPERASDPILKNTDGSAFFRSLIEEVVS